MEVVSQAPFKKPKRLTSLVWNDFERVKKGDVMVAICKHCKRKMSGSSTSGTSHLRNHLKRCLKKTNRDMGQQVLVVRERKRGGNISLGNFRSDQEPSSLELGFVEDRSRLEFKFDHEQSRYDLARMIILHEYPLAMVEHVGFRKFVENLQPAFHTLSCDRVKADCVQIYLKEKQKVYQVLDKIPGRVSLTADTFTSDQDNVYLCLTANYIDNAWILQRKILNFVRIDPYTEEVLSEIIMKCLMDWDIDRKLFSLTLDYCSTNDNAIFRTRDRLSQGRLLLCNGQFFHLRCVKDLLYLIVLDVFEEMHDVIFKIRESVKYVRSSEIMQVKFRELAQQLRVDNQKKLCLDCPLQWNSTYAMLEVAVDYRSAFTHLQECDAGYTMALSDEEWERAIIVTAYLKLFVDVMNAFSRVKCPTANLYFPEICHIHSELIDWCKSSDDVLNRMALKMKHKFDIYWSICSPVLAIAAILDPRFKMKLVEYYYSRIYDCSSKERIKDVSSSIKDLYNDYAICSTLASLDHGLACDVRTSGMNGTLTSGNDDTRDRLRGFDKFINDTTNSQHMKSELDKYLEEPVFPRNVDFSILNWWKVSSPKYPILSMMARDVLGVPVSTALMSDSAFSTGGKVLDPRRSSLHPDVLQALMCTHDWFREELEDCEPALAQSSVLCIPPNSLAHVLQSKLE